MVNPDRPPSRSADEAAEMLAAEMDRLAPRRADLGDAGAFAVSGWTLMNAWEFEAAELAWAQVETLDSSDVEAPFRRGECLLELGRNDDGAAAFRRAMERDAANASDPNAEGLDWIDDDPAHRLGNCLHAAGDLSGALEAYEESARRNATGVAALREIARCHLALGDGASALDACDRLQARARTYGVHGEVLAMRSDAERLLAEGGAA